MPIFFFPFTPVSLSFFSYWILDLGPTSDRVGLRLLGADQSSLSQSRVSDLMEDATTENSQPSSYAEEQHSEDMIPHLSNHEDAEPKPHTSPEEIKSIMEIIAATGKFWHDWDMLKNMLSFWLKQVLADYPDAQMVSGDGRRQSSLLGETFPELVRRLDEALLSFIEGPPFTLQRFCEILLTPKSTYRNLSKLALALEKNLLVTSTLRICTDPYPRSESPKPIEPDRPTEEPQIHSAQGSNGEITMAGDGVEEMVEAVANEDAPTADTESDGHAPIADTESNDAQNVDTEMQVGEMASDGTGNDSVLTLKPEPACEPCANP